MGDDLIADDERLMLRRAGLLDFENAVSNFLDHQLEIIYGSGISGADKSAGRSRALNSDGLRRIGSNSGLSTVDPSNMTNIRAYLHIPAPVSEQTSNKTSARRERPHSRVVMEDLTNLSVEHLCLRKGATYGNWCQRGCLVGVYKDGIGLPDFDAPSYGIVTSNSIERKAKASETLPGTESKSSEKFVDNPEDYTNDSELECLRAGITSMQLPTELATVLMNGTSDEFLCVDPSGVIYIWDQKSSSSRVFAIVLHEHCTHEASDASEAESAVSRVNGIYLSPFLNMLSMQVQQQALHKSLDALILSTLDLKVKFNMHTQGVHALQQRR
jgi:hypothetical protein